jgi:hypothetical protein
MKPVGWVRLGMLKEDGPDDGRRVYYYRTSIRRLYQAAKR